jgi:acetoin utilization deacetylase AcuC-like enzyme
MLPFKLVHHPGYDLNFGEHVFPTQKYALIRRRLLDEGFAAPEDFVEPAPAPDEDILAVHRPEWVDRLKNGTLSYFDILKLEVPYSRQMVRAFWLAAGGTTLAARLALRDGIGFNIGGGFHHAFPGHGEGFCAIHDVAVAIRRVQKEGLVRRAMVVDCDVHHGNGTAAIFAGDQSVFTISIHQLNNYPPEKPPSNIDINLDDETGDDEYVDRLRQACLPAVATFRPELLVYIAGADPYYQDQLGGLSLTLDGLLARDRLVISCALVNHAAVAVALAGGYAADLNDTVTIHANTVRAAKEVLDHTGWKRRT